MVEVGFTLFPVARRRARRCNGSFRTAQEITTESPREVRGDVPVSAVIVDGEWPLLLGVSMSRYVECQAPGGTSPRAAGMSVTGEN